MSGFFVLKQCSKNAIPGTATKRPLHHSETMSLYEKTKRVDSFNTEWKMAREWLQYDDVRWMTRSFCITCHQVNTDSKLCWHNMCITKNPKKSTSSIMASKDHIHPTGVTKAAALLLEELPQSRAGTTLQMLKAADRQQKLDYLFMSVHGVGRQIVHYQIIRGLSCSIDQRVWKLAKT